MTNAVLLIPVDVSVSHDRSALFAEAAERIAAGASAFVLAVVPGIYFATSTDPNATIAAMETHAKSELDALVAASPLAGAETRVAYGPVSRMILETAREVGATLILMHAQRPGPAAHALGSIASRVTNHAAASVRVVREGLTGP